MKTVKIKSAIPIYASALVWLVFGLCAPMYKWRYILLALGVSVVIYIVASIIFPGREEEVEAKANSGDSEIDRQIEEGRARLRSLKAANDALPDPTITARLNRMTVAGEKIFQALEKDTTKAYEVRRFMNYYLPTAEKLMDGYQSLKATGSQGEHVISAMKGVEDSLEMIANAFEKQLDSLYSDRSLDIQTDIDALETILKAEGLHENSPEVLKLGNK